MTDQLTSTSSGRAVTITLTWFPVGEERSLAWPEGWPIPSVGDTVHLPSDDEPAREVRHVEWCMPSERDPLGSVEIVLR
jgi:hypothetical protein